MKDIAAIVLAAGRGTRMKSKLPKVVHRLCSRPILDFTIEAIKGAGIGKIVLVVGYKAKIVKSAFSKLDVVKQNKLLGSGDAVRSARAALSRHKGDVLVLYGDIPLIRKDTIKSLIKKHKKEKASCTLLTANVENPSGYGRVLKGGNGNIRKIIEEQDATIYEQTIGEVNVGCYCFNKTDLFHYLDGLKVNAQKREYYLTDIVEILAENRRIISSVSCKDPAEAFGINTRLDLARAGGIVKKKALETLMLRGVTIVDPDSTLVDMDARIGRDTIIYPHTIIEKGVTIGEDCKIGPFARIRPGTALGGNVEVGNFVELVRTKVSSGTKIKHLTYLGDAEVGRNVNIGAGTITANFDGKKKNKTIIEDEASIGVGSIFVAPVKVGHGAVVGAGSVVTKNKDVPPRATVAGIPARKLGRKR